MELNNVQTLYSFETEYNADSVEWCPHDPHKNLFVCANYQLIENETSGKLNPKLAAAFLIQIALTLQIIVLNDWENYYSSP